MAFAVATALDTLAVLSSAALVIRALVVLVVLVPS
jgi:hypothetical protein